MGRFDLIIGCCWRTLKRLKSPLGQSINGIILAITCISLFALGCGSDSESEPIQPQIQLLMAPGLLQHNPTKVEISITDSTGAKINRTAEISGEERSVTFDLEVSAGTIQVTITVFYRDIRPVTEPPKTVKVTPEQNIFIFSLDPPNQLSVGIDSDQSFPIRLDEEFSVYVYVRNLRNIADLYGASIRLTFNEAYILPTKIEHDTDFWGTGGQNFTAISAYPGQFTAQIEPVPGETVLKDLTPGALNIAWSRLGDSESSSDKPPGGKQKLATIYFKAKQATTGRQETISFVVDDNGREVFRLKNRNGEDVEGFSDLKAWLPQRKYPIEIR